jgi:hypothetical protein
VNLSRELIKSFLVQAFGVLVRLSLTSVGGMLIERGLVQENQWQTFLVGLATVLATLAWSLAEKYNLFKYLGLALNSETKTTLEELKK